MITELQVHLRPRDEGRRRACRPESEGDDPLGLGGARPRRRSPPLRPALHNAEPGRRARGQRLPREPQPRFARREERLPRRALARVGDGGRLLPARARRLFHRRPGQRADPGSSSTGPSRCATRGARSRRRRAPARDREGKTPSLGARGPPPRLRVLPLGAAAGRHARPRPLVLGEGQARARRLLLRHGSRGRPRRALRRRLEPRKNGRLPGSPRSPLGLLGRDPPVVHARPRRRDRRTSSPTRRASRWPFSSEKELSEKRDWSEWLGGRDSNPDSQIQSLESYRWTTPQSTRGRGLCGSPRRAVKRGPGGY